jgi:hypothetical protein
MTSAASAEITRLLKAWGTGDESALDRLIPKTYDELRRIARRYMRMERKGVTLQATALVNEVYLRLVNVHDVGWQDRAHFFAVTAQMIRRILVDAARHGRPKNAGASSGVLNIPCPSTWTKSPTPHSCGTASWSHSMRRSKYWGKRIFARHGSSNCGILEASAWKRPPKF